MGRSGLSLAVWFSSAILVLGGDGDGRVPPRLLAQQVGVSYKTAVRIRNTVTAAMGEGGSDADLLRRLLRVAGSERTGDDGTAADRDRTSRARDNIRAAACRAFAARGPAATRIVDIAREAGVSSAIIHYYYRSKDEVLLAALKWATEQTDRRLAELCRETAAPVERLRRTLELAIPAEGILRDETLLWLEVWVRVRLHPELLADCVAMSARWAGFLEQVIAEGEEAGVFHPVIPPAELAQRLVAIADGLGFRSAVGYTGMHVQRVSELLQGFAAEQLGIPAHRWRQS